MPNNIIYQIQDLPLKIHFVILSDTKYLKRQFLSQKGAISVLILCYLFYQPNFVN